MERNTVRGGRGASKGALLLSIYICVYIYIYIKQRGASVGG